jgi:hypothetical protein
MAKKQETPVKAGTLDKRDANRQANRQKQPYQPNELHKLDKKIKNN